MGYCNLYNLDCNDVFDAVQYTCSTDCSLCEYYQPKKVEINDDQ